MEINSLCFTNKPFLVFEEFKSAAKLFGPRDEIDKRFSDTGDVENLASPGSSPEDILISKETSSFRQQIRDQEEERREREAWKLRKQMSRFLRAGYWGEPYEKLPKQLGFSRF